MISESEVLDVREPPGKAMGKVAELWKPVEGTNKIMCTACARYCKIGEGQVGLCGIRGVHQGKLWLYVYGRVITGHVDPIEKKPVSHFRPGSKIFSIATTGCNWLCRYCFLPETQVLTEQGYRSIESLFAEGQPTDSSEVRMLGWTTALTHRNRWRIIEKAFEHIYAGQVLEIRIRGSPVLHCTPDHRMYVQAATGLEEVRADHLRPNDLVAIPRDATAMQKPNLDSDLTSAGGATALTLLTAEKLTIAQETDEYALVPIAEISEKTYVGPVYNIEVEEDHSYTANLMAVSNCQNADISQRRKVEGIEVEPQDVVRMTLEQGCQGLAYTYNQPTIFIEFARDIGMLARKAGLINIFVSNGYDTPETVAEMPKFLDCVTVDFKGSGETNFVRKYINIPNADPIFQTLLDTRDTKKIHIEITDLIVPQVGDDLGAARKLSKWVHDNLGPDTPIHFLRFHPDYKMMEFPWTPVETLEKHCAVAKEEGLKYVYIGNVSGHPLENTYCPGCGAIAIKRYGFDITGWYLDKDNKCKKCGYKLAIFGRLEKTARENRFYSVLYHR
jgi:pyruvate formate lyase activating enzyme